jgi:hypothetical protein
MPLSIDEDDLNNIAFQNNKFQPELLWEFDKTYDEFKILPMTYMNNCARKVMTMT